MTAGTPWRVDLHAHWYPEAYYAYLDRVGQLEGLLATLGRWSLEAHIAFMDEYGIEASVLSFGDPQVSLGAVEDRIAVARAVNDEGRALIDSRGARFGIFGVTPMPEVDAAVAEVGYVLDDLGLDGICLLTNYQGAYLGDERFTPLYEALDARGAYVFVHPTGPPVDPTPDLRLGRQVPALNFIYEYTWDTTRAITSLIYNGVAARFPNIRWHFVHAGGTLPFLAFRLATLHGFFPPFAAGLPAGPLAPISHLFFDDAVAYTPAQLRPLLDLVPLEHVMFGSDWPPMRNLFGAGNVQRMPFLEEHLPTAGDPEPSVAEVLSPDKRRTLERDNALRHLPRLADRMRGGA